MNEGIMISTIIESAIMKKKKKIACLLASGI